MSNQTLWIYKLQDLMSPGLQKIERTKSKLDGSIRRTEFKSKAAFSRMGKFSQNFGKVASSALGSVSSVAPGLAANLGLVANPITAIAAAALAAGKVLVSATQQAAAFQHEFLELKNLNLDKTNKQIDQLSDKVLNASLFAKQGANETARAFFDVQSVTGKYGDEVDKVVRKIGVFSGALKVDFNQQVESAAVAMKNFGFDVNQLDRFLASSFKTVQVGKVTFEQLARVQTDFAGAATKAFQSYDSANQLFAVFSTRAKSAEEAATLTKSAFQDLFKASTVKAFKKTLDINLFDPVTGLPKQLDQIVREANKRFQELGKGSPERLNKLVNKFTGSDGLVQLISAAAFQGDEFIRTLDQFNKTDFNIDKALGNAKEDFAIVSQQLKNQWQNILIRIGNKVLPVVTRGLSAISDFVDRTARGFQTLNEKSELFRDIMGFLGRVAVNMGEIFKKQFSFIGEGMRDMFSGVRSGFVFVENGYRRVKAFLTNAFNGIKLLGRAAVELTKLNFDKADKLIASAGNEFSRKIDVKFESFREKTPIKTNVSPLVPEGSFPTSSGSGGSGGSGSSKVGESLNGVVSRTQTRNVTVNISKLVETLEIRTTNIQEGAQDLQRKIEEILVRAIRDSELALS